MFLNSMFSQMFTGVDGEGPFGGGQAPACGARSSPTNTPRSSPRPAASASPTASTRTDRAAGGASEMTQPVSTKPAPQPIAVDGRSREPGAPSARRDGRAGRDRRAGNRAGARRQAQATRPRSKPTKAELARALCRRHRAGEGEPAGAGASRCPDLLAALRKQHDTFNALLQINLTVLATAHAVSEGLIRGAPCRGRAQERAADLWQLGPRHARRRAACRDAGLGQPHAVALLRGFLAIALTRGEIISRDDVDSPKSSPGFRAAFAPPLTTFPNGS